LANDKSTCISELLTDRNEIHNNYYWYILIVLQVPREANNVTESSVL